MQYRKVEITINAEMALTERDYPGMTDEELAEHIHGCIADDLVFPGLTADWKVEVKIIEEKT